MAQAQMALERKRASLWSRIAKALARARERRQTRKALVRYLSELDTGIASGARL